jgi:hypothetical protein
MIRNIWGKWNLILRRIAPLIENNKKNLKKFLKKLWACARGRLKKLILHISNSDAHPLQNSTPYINNPHF